MLWDEEKTYEWDFRNDGTINLHNDFDRTWVQGQWDPTHNERQALQQIHTTTPTRLEPDMLTNHPFFSIGTGMDGFHTTKFDGRFQNHFGAYTRVMNVIQPEPWFHLAMAPSPVKSRPVWTMIWKDIHTLRNNAHMFAATHSGAIYIVPVSGNLHHALGDGDERFVWQDKIGTVYVHTVH